MGLLVAELVEGLMGLFDLGLFDGVRVWDLDLG
jgi:hypothetical protein